MKKTWTIFVFLAATAATATAQMQMDRDMAAAELNWGADPVMRRLVEQQSEIDVMQLWLQKKSANKIKKNPL